MCWWALMVLLALSGSSDENEGLLIDCLGLWPVKGERHDHSTKTICYFTLLHDAVDLCLIGPCPGKKSKHPRPRRTNRAGTRNSASGRQYNLYRLRNVF